MLEWLVFSKEKDDVQLITADSEMWSSTEFIDKVTAKEGKDVLLFKDNQVRTYIVVKHGCGNYKPDLEKLRQEFSLGNTSNISTSHHGVSVAARSRSDDCFSEASNDAITVERQASSTLPTGSHESDLCESIESQKEETSETAKMIKLVSVSFPTTS